MEKITILHIAAAAAILFIIFFVLVLVFFSTGWVEIAIFSGVLAVVFLISAIACVVNELA
jgi:hypothetical protein